jgi:hypothetical protein
MFSDDTQVAALLKSGNLLTDEQLKQLQADARSENKSLYQQLIECALIDEDAIVQVFAPAIGIGGVSLKDFNGDAMLMSIAPADVLRQEGILPVGIDEAGSRRILYVAMADPSNQAGIKTLSAYSNLPIVPLLAGPMDLLAAIDRCAERHLSGPDGLSGDFEELGDDDLRLDDLMLSGPRPTVFSSDPAILDDFIGGVPEAGGSSLVSALSLIDDIPRNRHSAATPPGGSELVEDDDDLIDNVDALMSGEFIAAPESVPPPTPLSNDEPAGAGEFSDFPPLSAVEPTNPRLVELSDLFPAVGGVASQELDQLDELKSGTDSDKAEAGGPRLPMRRSDPSKRATVVGPSSTGLGRPASPASGMFQRVETTVAAFSSEVSRRETLTDELLDHPLLLKALVEALHRNGILTVGELRSALERASAE